ncbi:hypothetical protein ABUE31_19480 [Mesorhizobium sp. ZMM04-5]|uniref:HEAT repeat domain-containing protein n=1 Tax=Mesorhizobium marinum TaxID=3228790 RepID=A0ABV3R514_9HYPH
MRTGLAGAILLLLGGSALAQVFVEPFVPPAGSDSATYYADNAARIDELAGQVRSGSPESRRTAFDELATAFPDAALSLALDLINDPDMAVPAARLLADSVVMTNHQVDHDTMPEIGHLIMARIEAAKVALLTLLDRPDDTLRRIAAGTLASLGDRRALDALDRKAKEGEVSDVEAINYFALATPEVGSSYISPYLKQGEGAAQESAVAYLSALPAYQGQIRDEILLNNEAKEAVRIAAAQSLGQYDRNFGDYAVTMAIDGTNLPPSLYTAVVSAYTKTAIEQKTLDPATVDRLIDSIERVQKEAPGFQIQLDELGNRLQNLKVQ